VEDLHGFGHPFEVMPPDVLQGKGLAHQALCHATDHHRVGRREPLQARGYVDRVARGQMLVSLAAAHGPDHHGPGMDTDPHRQLHRLLLFQAGVQRGGDGLDKAQTRMQGAWRIVFMGDRPAKVDQQPITEILRHMAFILLDDLSSGGLIGAHHLTQVFRVELLRQCGRVGEVTKHHGELATFGFRSGAGGDQLVLQGFWSDGLGGSCRPN
jgi:hypothetical protein